MALFHKGTRKIKKGSAEAVQLFASVESMYDTRTTGDGSHSAYCDQLKKYDSMYAGEQYDSDTKNETDLECVLNLCFHNVETLYALLKDLDIRPRVYPRFDKDPEGKGINVREQAVKVQKLLDFGWKESRVNKHRNDSIHDGCKYGDGYLKIFLDPIADNGNGLIKTRSVAPSNFIEADPGVADIQEQDWVAEIVPMMPAAICRRFDLTPEEEEILYGGTLTGTHPDAEVPDAQIKTSESSDTQSEVIFPNATGLLPVIEFHLKNRKAIKFQAGTEEKATKDNKWVDDTLKLPVAGTNKFIDTDYDELTIIYYDKLLLDVQPFYPHGLFPYAAFHDYEQPRKAKSIGEIHVAQHINKEINSVWDIVVDNMEAMGNSKIITCGDEITVTDMSNEAGGWWKVNKKGTLASGDMAIQQGLAVSGDHFLIVDKLFYWGELLSGLSSLLSGKPPGQGVTSGRAIRDLLDSVSQRIRPKVTNIAEFVFDIGNQFLALELEYYPDRFISIVGANGAPLLEQFKKAEGENPSWYRIEIEGENALPIGRETYLQLLMQMYMQPLEHEGTIGLETVFEAMGIPRRYELLEEIDRRKKEQFEKQKELIRVQAEAQQSAQIDNLSSMLLSDDPNQVQQGLEKLRILKKGGTNAPTSNTGSGTAQRGERSGNSASGNTT